MDSPIMPPSTVAQDPLARLQRWMQACVMASGPVEEAIAAPAALAEYPASEAPGLIRASRTLAPLQRLDIYRGMYELRLIEALRTDYPGLAHFLGERKFEELARLYISECPSQSYTLNRLGDRLPHFVRDVEGLPRPRFVESLAQLELIESIVFDEEETPAEEPHRLAAGSPEEWALRRLVPIPALRLVRLAYPAHEYLQAMRRGAPDPALRPRRAYLIVYRKSYGLFHLAVSEAAFALFTALAGGASLGEAMDRMGKSGASGTNVFEWFRRWCSEGLFRQSDYPS